MSNGSAHIYVWGPNKNSFNALILAQSENPQTQTYFLKPTINFKELGGEDDCRGRNLSVVSRNLKGGRFGEPVDSIVVLVSEL